MYSPIWAASFARDMQESTQKAMSNTEFHSAESRVKENGTK